MPSSPRTRYQPTSGLQADGLQTNSGTGGTRYGEANASDREKVSDYVVNAYLRTLCRYPNEKELERSLAYVDEANDPVEGLGDVLWALLNTHPVGNSSTVVG